MHRRNVLTLTLAAGVIAALAAPAASARDFTIASWGGNYQDAQREVYFAPFAASQGNITILEDTYLGGLAEIKSMVDAGNVTWDVVMVERNDLMVGCDEGLFEKLDWPAVGGEENMIPKAVHPCGAGSIVVNTGISYNADKVTETPKNWADFWNVEKWPGKRGLRAGPKMNLEFALLADGVALEEIYEVLGTPEGVERAFAKLDELKPHIQFWEGGAQPIEWLVAGDVALTASYNGRITAAQKEGKNLQFVWEQSLYGIDSWAVISGSPNRDLGMAFIKFANTAEAQAKFPELIPYGTTNKHAAALISPEVLSAIPAGDNMTQAFFGDEEFWADNVDELTVRWNNWVAK